MSTLGEIIFERHTKPKKPTASEESTRMARLKMLENRIALQKAREDAAATKKPGKGGRHCRSKPREEWSASDVLDSWKDDGAICEHIPCDEGASCPARGFWRDPFTVDTNYLGRLKTFTLDLDKEPEHIIVGYRVPANKHAETEKHMADLKSSLEDVVARRGTLLDVIEYVFWPFLAKSD